MTGLTTDPHVAAIAVGRPRRQPSCPLSLTDGHKGDRSNSLAPLADKCYWYCQRSTLAFAPRRFLILLGKLWKRLDGQFRKRQSSPDASTRLTSQLNLLSPALGVRFRNTTVPGRGNLSWLVTRWGDSVKKTSWDTMMWVRHRLTVNGNGQFLTTSDIPTTLPANEPILQRVPSTYLHAVCCP